MRTAVLVLVSALLSPFHGARLPSPVRSTSSPNPWRASTAGDFAQPAEVAHRVQQRGHGAHGPLIVRGRSRGGQIDADAREATGWARSFDRTPVMAAPPTPVQQSTGVAATAGAAAPGSSLRAASSPVRTRPPGLGAGARRARSRRARAPLRAAGTPAERRLCRTSARAHAGPSSHAIVQDQWSVMPTRHIATRRGRKRNVC